MEWRIIVAVLCLIGILYVPGNAAQINNSTNITIAYRFTLRFSINSPFLDVYLNSTNNVTVDLKNNITTQVEQLYKNNYTNFERFKILEIRNGSIVTEGELQFNNNGSKPNVTDLTQILYSGNVTFTIIQNATRIDEVTPQNQSTTATPATTPVTNQTSTPVTTVSAPAKVAQINFVFSIVQDFKDIYSNLTNAEAKELSNNITTVFSQVYRKSFPKFYRMFIRKFSKGSIVTDSVLEFDSTNGTSPNVTEVKDTLVKAIENGNFSFTINSSSISATDITETNGTTTANTSTLTHATTVSAASNLTDYNITFKLNDAFTVDLSNISSDGAKKLAKNITSELDGFYKGFKNFKRSLVSRFRSGSIVVDGLLGFNNTLANNPTASELAKGLAEAVRNGTVKLPIDPTTIVVTDSSGVAANRSPVLASMLTALWMTLASLLLSAVMH